MSDGSWRPAVHGDPRTWPTCLERGCGARVDPWDHNTRCAAHRPDPDAPIHVRRHVNVPTSTKVEG